MTALRQGLRDRANRGLGPARTLGELSRLARSLGPGMHATSVFAVLNTQLRTLTFANAGHPPPLLGGATASRFLEFSRHDVPLGVAVDRLPEQHTVELPAGALIVLYTDGVTERERNIVKGEEQLHGAAIFAHRCRDQPGASVIERQMFLHGSNEDDAAILTARMPEAKLGGTR
jgi:serine phosphatase RsbU (regulator of sigma subunit)